MDRITVWGEEKFLERLRKVGPGLQGLCQPD